MPEISRFEGIVISMYFNEHNPPHFHAKYNDVEALFDLSEGAFTKGALPSKQARSCLRGMNFIEMNYLTFGIAKNLKKLSL